MITVAEIGRARTALVAKVRETWEATGVMTLAQIAALLARDTERDDRAARRLATLLPVDGDVALLGEGSLASWIDLLVRTEKMDQLLDGAGSAGSGGLGGFDARLGSALVEMDRGADGPRPVDGEARLRGLEKDHGQV